MGKAKNPRALDKGKKYVSPLERPMILILKDGLWLHFMDWGPTDRKEQLLIVIFLKTLTKIPIMVD